MPFIKGGAVFVESDKEYTLGDSVFVLLKTRRSFRLTAKWSGFVVRMHGVIKPKALVFNSRKTTVATVQGWQLRK